jgi:hypothetical protein
MNPNLFTWLCDQLGYDPATVLVIRVAPGEASVTYLEPSDMPCGSAHRLESASRQTSIRQPDRRGRRLHVSPGHHGHLSMWFRHERLLRAAGQPRPCRRPTTVPRHFTARREVRHEHAEHPRHAPDRR